MTDTSGLLGNFTAWCLDLENWLQSSADYETTDTPFSNATDLGVDGMARVQAVFDANYSSVDVTDLAQSAAFQLSLWEAIYDEDNFDLTDGDFEAYGNYLNNAASATSLLISSLASTYLGNAASYVGAKVWDLTFLESDNQPQTQALVTASLTQVPVPAAGLLLITAFGGLAAFGRRKSA